jgi:D-inositol-3-phosphate glycosyltransferase
LAVETNECKMSNIAFFITTTGWGGLEMNVLKMALGLAELKYNVTLFACKNSKLALEAEGKLTSLIKIEAPKKYFGFRAAKKISQSLKKDNIDLIIVNDNRDLDVISWAKRLFHRKLKVIYHQQMQIGINKKDFIHTLRFKTINYWISPLNWLKVEIGQNTKYPTERVKIIPLCADVERYTKRKYSQKQALKKLGIQPKGKLVGIIGRISPKKGQGFVIEAMKELITKYADLELLVFGSATINDAECQAYEKNIHQYVKDNQLESVVHFKEFSADTELFYNSVDIFTIASESETFGMVTIEAMLSELPIIAADTGGSPEILDGGKLGRLYKYGNIPSYCEQVEWILNNNEEIKSMATKAKEKAMTEYSHLNEITRIAEVVELAKKD